MPAFAVVGGDGDACRVFRKSVATYGDVLGRQPGLITGADEDAVIDVQLVFALNGADAHA